MPRMDLHAFLDAAGNIAAGMQRGRQNAVQQQQQQEAQRTHEFQVMAGLDADKRAQEDAADQVLLSNLSNLDPASRLKTIGGVYDSRANRAPSPFTAANLPGFQRTRQLPPPPPVINRPAPPVPPAPAPVPTPQDAGAPVASLTPAPGSAGVPEPGPVVNQTVPVATPAPVIHTKYGDLSGNAVSKERQARMQTNYKLATDRLYALPEADPRRVEGEQRLRTLNHDPQTDAEADLAESVLNDVITRLPGAGKAELAAAATSLREWNENAPKVWGSLQGADERLLPDMIRGFARQATEAGEIAKKLGQKPLLPLGYEGESEPLAEMARADAEGNTAEVTRIATEIGRRVKAGTTFAQQTARGRLALDTVLKLPPLLSLEEFDRQAHSIYNHLGVGDQYPEKGGLNGAQLEKYKQSLLGKWPSLAKLTGRAQSVPLNEIRKIIRLQGGDPNVIPPFLSESMNPKEQADWKIALMTANTFAAREADRVAKAKREAEEWELTKKTWAAKGAGGITQGQTVGIYRSDYLDAYKKEQAAYGSFTHDQMSLNEETGKVEFVDWLQKSIAKGDPLGARKAAAAVEAAYQTRKAAGTTYHDYLGASAAPAGRGAPASGASRSGAVKTSTAGAPKQLQPRSYYFKALKKRHPNATDAEINAKLDRHKVR